MKIHKILYRFLMVITLSCLSPLASADTVTILSDKWFPVNGDPKSDQPGYMIEIAKTILNKHGHSLDYRLAPWTRSLIEVREGRADCVVGAYKEDAKDFIFPENPWGKAKFNFYTKADSLWTFNDINDLALITLGVVSGYAYNPKIDKYVRNNHRSAAVQLVSGESALEQNIRKLLVNRIDALIAYDVVIESELKILNISDKLKVSGEVKPPEFMYIACSPEKSSSIKYTKLFSDGVVELREKGVLQRILKKYGIKDWIDGSK